MTLPFEDSRLIANCIQSEDELNILIKQLSPIQIISVDVEGDFSKLIGLGLCWKENNKLKSVYIPFEYTKIKISKELAFTRLEDIIGKNTNTIIYGHYFKYDYQVLKKHGFEVSKRIIDSFILSWVLNSNLYQKERSLNALAIKYGLGSKASFKEVNYFDLEEFSNYCRRDVELTYQLIEKLLVELKKTGDDKLQDIARLEFQLIPYIAEIELRGVYLDIERLEELNQRILKKLGELDKEFINLTGRNLNLRSPQQILEIIPENLKIYLEKTEKQNFSTDEKSLKKIAKEFKPAELILKYRSLSTIKDTFVTKLLERCEKKEKYAKIYSVLEQSGTNSGRFSSEKPNLQNIPNSKEYGNLIRSAFVAPEDEILIIADYSQLELRVLAILTKDYELLKIYNKGGDLHSEIQKLLSVSREFAKRINFGILYGESAYSLANDLQISKNEAQKIINSFHERFPRVLMLKKYIHKTLDTRNYLKTYFGRRRYFDVSIKNEALYRQAFNFPCQGTAADIVKISMLFLSKENIIPPIMQIHDELIFRIPEKDIKELPKKIKEIMEKNRVLKQLPIPFEVELKLSKRWAGGKLLPLN